MSEQTVQSEKTAITPVSESWNTSVKRIGVSTLFVAILISFLPFLYLYFKYGVMPHFSVLMNAWMSVALAYGAMYVIEPLSYFPSLGLSGSYMSWLAGSVAQMRVSSSVVAKEILSVEDGSQEAEVVSTAAIAGSIVINIAVLTVAAFAGYQILGVLPEVVKNALNSFIVPSIFGALVAMMGGSRLIVAVPVYAVLLGVNYARKIGALPVPSWVILVFAVFGTMIYTRILYKKGKV